MPTSRVVLKRLPTCPGKDSRFHVRSNRDKGNAWWIHYIPRGGSPIPADDPHSELVALVNELKGTEGVQAGGAFSINEHGQVIVHTSAPIDNGQSIHVIGVRQGKVVTYDGIINFDSGALSPTLTPTEGDPWLGPLCGMSYRFAAPRSPKAPSHKMDEVFEVVEGQSIQLSIDANITPYPPTTGPLAYFLESLRKRLPKGGRFRVNEHGRAFTSDGKIFIGVVPKAHWFKPLTPRS
jgi:hypothetical protein